MKNVNCLIIGAGISGVSIAYNLARKGMKNIHVVDKGYFTSGATGRCGAGVRQQWNTETNCILAKKSIEFFEHKLDQAKKLHAGLKNGSIPRQHSMSMQYANKDVKDLEQKYQLALKMWA